MTRVIWSDRLAKGFPFKAYAIYKEDHEYRRKGRPQPGKRLATLGVNAKPQLTETRF